MSSGSPPSRNPAGHSGLLDNALGLLSAVVEFFESRFVLLAQESKSAALQLLILVGCVIAALGLCVMGYVFLIVSAVVGLAHLLGTSWPVVALVVAAGAFHYRRRCYCWWRAAGSPNRCFGIALTN